VPITCTLDLISFIECQGLIDTVTRQTILHKLREAGFGLIPVTQDELERFLRAAAFDPNNKLIESAELRVIRQYLMRIRSLDMIQSPLEAPFLTQLRLVCILTIRRLWQDDGIPIDRTSTLTNWVWDNVSPSPLDWECAIRSGEDNPEIRQKYVSYLIPLFSPMGHMNPVRHNAFLQWIEQTVLERLLPANEKLIDDLANGLKLEIGQIVKRLSDANSSNPDR